MRRNTIEILHEDDALVVVNKPVGSLCAPERSGEGETIIDALSGLLSLAEPLRLVHRLDRDTSGVLVLVKTKDAQRAMSQQFMRRTIEKSYLALVRGVPEDDSGQIHAPIAQCGGGNVRVSINPRRGREAITRWQVLERFAGFALLRCKPLTGRQHQIRIHMQLAQMPLAVDPMYGGGEGIWLSNLKPDYRPSRSRPERPLIDRLTLHAERIAFDHPSTGARCCFEATLPKDFRATLNQLRKHIAAGPNPMPLET